jgi:hypothetical protein
MRRSSRAFVGEHPLGESQDRRITPMRRVSVCRFCRRELEIRQEKPKAGGYVPISLVCPKHGALGRGERFLQGYVG